MPSLQAIASSQQAGDGQVLVSLSSRTGEYRMNLVRGRSDWTLGKGSSLRGC